MVRLTMVVVFCEVKLFQVGAHTGFLLLLGLNTCTWFIQLGIFSSAFCVCHSYFTGGVIGQDVQNKENILVYINLGWCVAFWTGEDYFVGGGKNLDGVQGPKIMNYGLFQLGTNIIGPKIHGSGSKAATSQ